MTSAVKAAPRRRKAKGGRRSARRQRTTIAGIFLVFVVLAAGVVFLLGVTDAPKRLPAADLAPISGALLHVPAADVAGSDLDGVPRPAGSTRAYARTAGKIQTVIYSRKGGYDEVLKQVPADLATAGWAPPQGRSPGRAPGQAKSWTNVFKRQAEVLQVSIISLGGVTSTTYILQVGQ